MNTKRILHTLFKGLLAILVLTGCMDDDLGKTINVIEGQPITVTLKLSGTPAADVTLETRADNSLSELSNLTIFVYDSDGKYQQTETWTKEKLTPTSTGDDGVIYTVSFKTTSGAKKLLAMGNRGGGYWTASSDISVSTMSFSELKVALLNLSVRLNEEGEVRNPIQMASNDQMLITGEEEDIVFKTDASVTDLSGNKKDIAVKMERTMAHITFNIAAQDDEDDYSFIPISYKVYNVPVGSYLVNKENNIISSNVTFNNYASTNIPTASEGNYTFHFYMPENIYGEVGNVTDYNSRDLWKYESTESSNPVDKDWSNAPPTSTFVVISGTYTGKTATEENGERLNDVTGTVEYTIHLGDFSGDKWGNFSVERNVSYIYKVSVLGVKNIIVEATTNKENQSSAEGEIYDNTNVQYTYNLDAHYEQVYLEYDLTSIAQNITEGLKDDALTEAIGNQLKLVIQSNFMPNQRVSLSPYERYKAGENKTDVLNGIDYKWIEFWPQTQPDYIAAYPGVSSWARESLENDAMNKDYYEGDYNTQYGSQYLMDVYDVIVQMGEAIEQIYNKEQPAIVDEDDRSEGKILITTNNGHLVARFTAFVNEYYYLRHPLTGEVITNWSTFTNTIPREMIIAMSTQSSNDGQSSYSNIHSYISQLSMQTFYNNDAGINGFGIETYNETPLTKLFGDPDLPQDVELSDADGRTNQIYLLNKKTDAQNYGGWNDFIEFSKNGWTKTVVTDHAQHKLAEDTYKKDAYAACLSRNRDLNGNGTIEPNELRWCMASLNEYIRTAIGVNVIANAARLYIGDKSDMNKEDYPGSYIDEGSLFYTSSSSTKRVFWAVEKGSYGEVGVYYDKAKGLPIRCIRILPAENISTITGISTSLTYAIEHNSNGNQVIKFKGRLVDGLYREYVDGVLQPHNENQDVNSFYDGIIVSKKRVGETANSVGTKFTLRQIVNYDGKQDNPCEDYEEPGDGGATWRVPNLVELSALNAAGLLGNGDACCTMFSNQKVRLGFAKNPNHGLIYCPGEGIGDTMENFNGTQFYVRCVRDVPQGYFTD